MEEINKLHPMMSLGKESCLEVIRHFLMLKMTASMKRKKPSSMRAM